VTGLLNLLREYFSSQFDELIRDGVRIIVIGDRERFPSDIQEVIRRIEVESAKGDAGTIALALSYGGRSEIVHAVNILLSEKKAEVDEVSFGHLLWTTSLRDPDLVIRTGGEVRLSNFLLWQSAYAELFFTKTLWPDFSIGEFDAILAEYGTREQRRGT
jgi:undecaprenyl diphosphate synthase